MVVLLLGRSRQSAVQPPFVRVGSFGIHLYTEPTGFHVVPLLLCL